MYAVIQTGGKQYTVKPGDVLHIEKLDKDLGAEFDISEVVMLGGESNLVGQPLIKNAKVTVVVTKQSKARKVIIFKKKRRKSFRKFKTHRQPFTEIFVKSITSPTGQVAKTEDEPRVVDVVQMRQDRILSKVAARQERVENRTSSETVAAAPKKAAAKKKVVKKAAAKGKAKKPTKKAAATKKAKKIEKKTTKKA
ncbi:MAG: 50S ribosomal protein L21 [Bdellovibrionales bacterium]|jgi:large subunit ribosomal protein L21|nr:50S ribosomal protein L21 [Bdellovibrionales bacterium]